MAGLGERVGALLPAAWGAVAGLLLPAAAAGQGPPCFHPVALGVNGRDAALIRSAHAGWMRTTFRWAEINPAPEVWDFGPTDELASAARGHGLSLLAILSTAPEWAGSNRNGTRPPADLAPWTEFVRRTAERYRGRVAAYEIWNEPNHGDLGLGIGWALPHGTPPLYVDYLRAAAEAIRAEAPGTLVVAPVTSSLPDSRTVEVFAQLETTFADGRHAGEFFDVVSFHANALDNERVSEVEGRVGAHLTILFHRSPTSRDKPVWITELGWKSNRVGEGSQRDRIAAMLAAWSGSCLPHQPSHAFIFQERDVPGAESRGLFRSDGSPKSIVSTYLATLPFPAATRDPLALSFSVQCFDLACEFEATEWLDNPFAPVACAWDFGDGSGEPDDCRVQHRYASSGVRTVRLEVTVDGSRAHADELVLEPTATCVDPEPPRVSLVFPPPGLDVTGRLPVALEALDNLRLARVDFLVDGLAVDSLFARPFRFAWQTGAFSTGPHALAIRAVDRCGNGTLSAPAVVFIDRRPPEVELLSPEPGELVKGRHTVVAAARDNRAVERVELWIGRRLRATDREPPYELAWQSSSLADGPHRLEVRAYDRAGNRGGSRPFAVRVDNTRPLLWLNHPAAAQVVAGGRVRISGWAVDGSGGIGLKFELDGRPLDLAGPAEAVDRETVCATHAALADPRCPAVGFRAVFDSTLLPDGPHRLRVVATDAAGLRAGVEIPFEIRNGGR
jgi:hypothetical protein